jgi:dienelactone hydrolase
MAEVLLFHHAQGQTPGFLAFTDELRAAGHTVHAPDLYDGRTLPSIDEGVAYAKEVGFDTILERGRLAAEGLPSELVYAGFSLGVMPAQLLAQTRPGAKGAMLFSAAIPASEFGGPWPEGVPLQIHMMEDDPWAEEDLPAARELEETAGAELFLYSGHQHLFADNSLPDYDEAAATLLKQRVREFLDKVE